MSNKLEHFKATLEKCKKELEETLIATNLTDKQRAKTVESLDFKIANLMDKIEREEKAEEGRPDYVEAVKEWMEDHDIYYVQKLDTYVERLKDKSFAIYPKASWHERYTEWQDKNFKATLTQYMEQVGRNFNSMTYSFRDQPSWVLNLMSRDDWVEPVYGEDHHWCFDVLMQSLGGDKRENIEHLERVIAYKFVKPEEFKLPALVVFGEGSVGKNILVDRVLAGMFGKEQTISVKCDGVIGNFNGISKGKTVVMMNEAISEKTDMETLKDLVHKEYLVINEKFVPQYTAENTPLYILGGNGLDSAVKLGGDHSDRRFSILKVNPNRTLAHYISQHLGIDREAAIKWLHKNDGLFSDRAEIAKWLGNLLTKYEGQEMPSALHGQDYNELVHKQSTIEQQLFEAVFNDPEFVYIEKLHLYSGYKRWVEKYGNTKFTLSLQKFSMRADDWIERNKPGKISVEKTSVLSVKRTSKIIYKKSNEKISSGRTDEMKYLFGEEWQGPWA